MSAELRTAHARGVLGSRGFPSWATPKHVYAALHEEFAFDFDPCPLSDQKIWDSRLESWSGKRVYCNPPYGKEIPSWLAKAREPDLAVYLLPARTDTAWWHDYALDADEIRFVRGRLIFDGPNSKGNPAPFPVVILVYRTQPLTGDPQ